MAIGDQGDRADADEALRALHLLGRPPEERFQRLVRLGRRIFQLPYAAIHLLDSDWHHTLVIEGDRRFDGPLEESICQFTVAQDAVLEIPDLSADPVYARLPMVAGPPHLRYYAGVPLRAPTGQKVGVFCVFGDQPRPPLTAAETEILLDLAAVVEREFQLESDVVAAGAVQQGLLPHGGPDVPGLEVAGRLVPARDAGGDFFDWQAIDGRRNTDGVDSLQVVIGDVMGKGLSSALISAGVQAQLKAHSTYVDLARAIHRTNRTMIADESGPGRFVTLWAARIDPATGAVTYVDAGHGLAAIVARDGSRRMLRQRNTPLGILPVDRWATATDVLREDETLLLVSDGVLDVFPDVDTATEAAAEVASRGLGCAELVARVAAFALHHETLDDVTAVAVRRAPVGADR